MRILNLFAIFICTVFMCSCGGGREVNSTTYRVSANVLGLSSGKILLLTNNNSDSITISSNLTSFFSTAVPNGSEFLVAIATQPEGQTCVLSNSSGTSNVNVTVSVVCQPGINFGPVATDVYGNSTGGALLDGTMTVVNMNSWANVMRFFDPPLPTAETTNGSIASDGLFNPGSSSGFFDFGTQIFINDSYLGSLYYVDIGDPSQGLTLSRFGSVYSGPEITPGTTIRGFNGWINLYPKVNTNLVWADLSTTSISSAQTNAPFHHGTISIITTDARSKNFPANIQTADYAPLP